MVLGSQVHVQTQSLVQSTEYLLGPESSSCRYRPDVLHLTLCCGPVSLSIILSLTDRLTSIKHDLTLKTVPQTPSILDSCTSSLPGSRYSKYSSSLQIVICESHPNSLNTYSNSTPVFKGSNPFERIRTGLKLTRYVLNFCDMFFQAILNPLLSHDSMTVAKLNQSFGPVGQINPNKCHF